MFEFDKMTEQDRTAIHEVMEQQTVSIAKAGIQATLNARVSILAAANPTYGTYRPDKTLEQNVGLSAALLSRFDLVWLMRDTPNTSDDLKLAKHVLSTHQNFMDICEKPPLSISQIRQLIKRCSQIKPRFHNSDTMQYLIDKYIQLRTESREQISDKKRKDLFISPRALSSLVRFSSAHAKLRLSDIIQREDVEEAMRLIEQSKRSIVSESHIESRDEPTRVDAIFVLLAKLFDNQENDFVRLDVAIEYCRAHGYNQTDVRTSIQEYVQLGVLESTEDELSIRMI